MTATFEDWKTRADQADLLETAQRYGATMKRSGLEYKGPCPNDGGRDRFSLSTARHRWYCRGGQCGGRGAIGMLQHIAGLSFLESCEALTGERNPSGARARPLSEAEQAERNRARIKNEEAAQARQAQEAAQNQETKEYCARIWSECVPVGSNLAEKYLYLFDLPIPRGGWPSCLGFHPALQYPGKGKMPALVARVDDVAGELTGIWREFIRADGRKADVSQQKLGLGPVAGGAVRIGIPKSGIIGPKLGIAEGVRTALGAWSLIGFQYPVWSCLSTSGLVGFEAPLGIERIVIYPDSDQPIKKLGEEYVPTIPPGRKAALAARVRLQGEGVAVSIAPEPAIGRDYLNVWQAHAREMA